jgi:hypothetical protein
MLLSHANMCNYFIRPNPFSTLSSGLTADYQPIMAVGWKHIVVIHWIVSMGGMGRARSYYLGGVSISS